MASKEELKQAYNDSCGQALDALIEGCVALGVASAPSGGGFSQEQMDANAAAAVAPIQGHVEELQKIVDQDVIDKQALNDKLAKIREVLGV